MEHSSTRTYPTKQAEIQNMWSRPDEKICPISGHKITNGGSHPIHGIEVAGVLSHGHGWKGALFKLQNTGVVPVNRDYTIKGRTEIKQCPIHMTRCVESM